MDLHGFLLKAPGAAIAIEWGLGPILACIISRCENN